MSITGPHCRGEIHAKPDLVGQQVGCPHCGHGFEMPAEMKPAEAKPVGVVLLEKLTAETAEHSRWFAVFDHRLTRTYELLWWIRLWLVLLFILGVVILVTGFTVRIETRPY